jgi:hypothetical protein
MNFIEHQQHTISKDTSEEYLRRIPGTSNDWLKRCTPITALVFGVTLPFTRNGSITKVCSFTSRKNGFAPVIETAVTVAINENERTITSSLVPISPARESTMLLNFFQNPINIISFWDSQ